MLQQFMNRRNHSKTQCLQTQPELSLRNLSILRNGTFRWQKIVLPKKYFKLWPHHIVALMLLSWAAQPKNYLKDWRVNWEFVSYSYTKADWKTLRAEKDKSWNQGNQLTESEQRQLKIDDNLLYRQTYLIGWNWIFSKETIQAKKLFKGGNYMRKYGSFISASLKLHKPQDPNIFYCSNFRKTLCF